MLQTLGAGGSLANTSGKFVYGSLGSYEYGYRRKYIALWSFPMWEKDFYQPAARFAFGRLMKITLYSPRLFVYV